MKWIELENEVATLEEAENLLSVYFEFLDDRPTKERLLEIPSKDAVFTAALFSQRTETYISVLHSAFDLISKVKENLNTAFNAMLTEARETKEARL